MHPKSWGPLSIHLIAPRIPPGRAGIEGEAVTWIAETHWSLGCRADKVLKLECCLKTAFLKPRILLLFWDPEASFDCKHIVFLLS